MKRKEKSLTAKVIAGIFAGYGVLGGLITLFIVIICLFISVLVIVKGDITFIGTKVINSQSVNASTELDPNSPTYYYDMAQALDIDKIQSDWNSKGEMKQFFQERALNKSDGETPGKLIDIFILLNEICVRTEINSSTDTIKLYPYYCMGCWVSESGFAVGSGERLVSCEIPLKTNSSGYSDPLGDSHLIWVNQTTLKSTYSLGNTYICKQENETLDDSKRAILGGSGNLFGNGQAVYVTDEHFTRKDHVGLVQSSDEAYKYLQSISSKLERPRGDITWLPDSCYTFYYKARVFSEGLDRDTHNKGAQASTITKIAEELNTLGVPQETISECIMMIYMSERYYRADMDRWPSASNYAESSTSGGLTCALVMMNCEGLLNFEESHSLSEFTNNRVISKLVYGDYKTYTLDPNSAYSKLVEKINSRGLKYNWDQKVINCALKMQSMWASGNWGPHSQSYYKYFYSCNNIVQGKLVDSSLKKLVESYYNYQDETGAYCYRKYTIEETSEENSNGEITEGDLIISAEAKQVLLWLTGAEAGAFKTLRDKDLAFSEVVVMSVYNRAQHYIAQGKVTNLSDGVLAAISASNQFSTVSRGGGSYSFSYKGSTYNVPMGWKGENNPCAEQAIQGIFSTDANREVVVKHMDDLYRTGESFRYIYFFRSDYDTASGSNVRKCGTARDEGGSPHYCYMNGPSSTCYYKWWGQYSLAS